MNCPNCGHESKGKFCGKCGTPLVQAQPSSEAAAKIIDPLSAGLVGAAVGAAATAVVAAAINRPTPEDKKGEKVDSVTELEKCCIKLELTSGVIARKVTEKEMEAYASREGVIVSPGTLLIVIADGVIVSKLSGGRYALPMDRGKHVAHLGKEATGNFIDRVINWFRKTDNVTEEKAITHEEAERIRKAKHISLVLVREGDFILPFEFKNLPFAGGVTSDVGITLLLKVNDAEALFKHAMVDIPIADDLRKILEPRLQMELSRILPSYSMSNFVPGPEILDGLPPVLRGAMDSTYPGIVILRVITASTTGDALKSIREASNELYLNKLKLAQNEELLAARNVARSQSNRKLLDDSKNDAEMAAAVRAIADEARRSGLLSDENMEVFQREMVERFKDRNIESLSKDMKRSQVIELLDIDLQLEKDKAEIKSRILRNDDKQELLKQELGQDHELTKQSLEQQLQQNRLKYEIDFGIAHADIAVERARDAYGDERAEKGLDFDARKTRLDTDLHHDKKKKQLERLAELQAIREQRGEAAHQRELAAKQQADATKLHEMDRFKEMTFEQIMAMKQDLSGEAGARALEARFGVDHARELVAREREMAEREQAISAQHQEKSSESKEAELKRMEAMMDRMQQMAEATIKQTAAIASGQVAQAKSTREDVVSAMESTLKASGQVFSADARAKGPKQPQQNPGKPAKVRYCKSCEAELDSDSTFCPECGEKVE
jgi:hypothetical protein